MKMIIASIGRLKSGEEKPLFDKYVKRSRDIAKLTGINSIDFIELAESQNRSIEKRKEEESDAILKALPTPNFLTTLDQTGKSLSSDKLSKLIHEQRTQNTKNFTFVIGGADGLSSNILAKSNLTLAFGSMTWPHQLVRIMLVEQIYRAFTILNGHPYHRM